MKTVEQKSATLISLLHKNTNKEERIRTWQTLFK